MSVVLRQPIPIMPWISASRTLIGIGCLKALVSAALIIFSIGWQPPILKRPPFSYRINGIGLKDRYQRYLISRYYKRIL
jgi:hypothetical protein